MPAKTVKDIIAVNNLADPDDKVFINFILDGNKYLKAFFCNKNGKELIQNSEERNRYYNIDKEYWYDAPFEKGVSFLPRSKEPESDKPLYPWGSASCKSNYSISNYNCHGAWFISETITAKGFGPLLYDCLLEILGKSNLGLAADRGLVSSDAANIWFNYATRRSEVKQKLFDLDGSTPEEEDDCYSQHERDPGWNRWIDPNPEDSAEEVKKKKEIFKAVNSMFVDNGIKVIEELQAAGLILGNNIPVIQNNINEQFLLDLYKSLILESKKL